MKEILFICKYNRFRSKLSEAYFNRENKNKNFRAKSEGIIEVNRPLLPSEKKRNEEIKLLFGLRFDTKSRGIEIKSLLKSYKIIVVANDIPKRIFDSKSWKNKVEIWKVRDETGANEKNVKSIGKQIIKKVDRLIKELEGKK